MPTVHAWGAASARAKLTAMTVERRTPRARDVVLAIEFCGICHSDLHQVRDEWGGATFPMVPGHEIVGRVVQVGPAVTKFRAGDRVGVGCMVGSCGACGPCRDGLEQFCEKGFAGTYNGTEMDRKTPTQGGYSAQIVVDEAFVLRVPEGLDPAGAAPLLCAGITTYSPLRQLGCKPGDRIGVVGLGGLGHMAVKLAKSMGAEVTVLSSSPSKEAAARALGADRFVVTKGGAGFAELAGKLDAIVDTVSAPHEYGPYLGLLRARGSLVLVGAPPGSAAVEPFALLMGGKRLVGSLIGGIAETQEMLDHCAAHGIVSDVEIIPVQKVDEAFERMLAGDVRYRFVIDLASLGAAP